MRARGAALHAVQRIAVQRHGATKVVGRVFGARWGGAAVPAGDGRHLLAQVFNAVRACVGLPAMPGQHPRVLFVLGRSEGED